MLNSTVLEVAIGLILIYFLFTNLCSAIQEAIASWMGLRAKNLESGLIQLVGPAVKDALYAHQLITGLVHDPSTTPTSTAPPTPAGAAPDRAKPQYIEPRTFSRALIDILTGDEPPSFGALVKAVQADPTGVKQAIGALIGGLNNVAGPDVARDLAADAGRLKEAKVSIENWYNDAMERLSGRYKRNTQVMILIISALVTLVCNLDTLNIADSLAKNGTVRASVVAVADKAPGVAATPLSGSGSPLKTITDEVTQLQGLQVPIGWSSAEVVVWPRKITGLIVTTLALTLGAPFWFDLLNRMVNVRAAGRRPNTHPEGQAPAAPTA